MPWYDAEGADLVRAQQTPPPTSSFPDFTGSGSPEGVITAAVGKSYVDTVHGALYFKSSTFETGVADNIGWVLVGGSDATGYASVPGVLYRAGDVHLAAGTAQGLPGELTAGQVYIGDAWSSSMGNGNGIRWTQPGGDDSAQSASVQLGDSGQFNWLFKADGTTEFPGPITAAGQVRSIEAAFLGPAGQNITLADEGAYAGTGNSIQIRSTQTDGSQWVLIALGPNGEFATQFNADGTTEFPGPVSSAKVNGGSGSSLELSGDGGGGGVLIGDEFLDSGAGNTLQFSGDGIDGHQIVRIVLGGPDAFVETHFNADGTTEFPGPIKSNHPQQFPLFAPAGQAIVLTDEVAWDGSGNGLYLKNPGADGDQNVGIFLGPDSAFATKFKADGTTDFPGDVTLAAGAGPVIHDDADGHTYRIGSHNGAVTLTQVT